MANILITGATGFVGRHLVDALARQNEHSLYLVTRHKIDTPHNNIVISGGFDKQTNWMPYLKSIHIIIHLAARVHILDDTAVNPLDEYREVNTFSSIQLAKCAAKSGVKRIVFLSSIKVNGEYTLAGAPFTETVNNIPDDPYALSKYETEQELITISKTMDIETVIVRPPLIYGIGVKANFKHLIKLVLTSAPLPLGGIRNSRSILGIDNLTAFLSLVSIHTAAANQTFLICDEDAVSTPKLIQLLSQVLQTKTWVFFFPQWVLFLLARLLNKQNHYNRLADSLEIDASKAKKMLDWHAPYSTKDGFIKLAKEFK